MKLSAFILFLACLMVSCDFSEPPVISPQLWLPEVEHPDDNHPTPARIDLGKKLFFDPILSKDSSTSCATCHKPELAFADREKLSRGFGGLETNSNSPSLTNIAFHPYFTRAGGVPTLEMQVQVPLQEHNELNFNIVDLAEKLVGIEEFNKLSKKAYDRDLDYYVITRAIACFERSLISGNSPFDHYQYASQEDALTESEKRGMKLFFSDRTNCSSCHSGFNFTNYSFKNNGLYQAYSDSGRMRVTKVESDRALFKVPSLRNVELTAPYMHDGSMTDLEAVIDHYNQGGLDHKNKSSNIKPLNLSLEEKQDLLLFLKSLTDIEFTSKHIK